MTAQARTTPTRHAPQIVTAAPVLTLRGLSRRYGDVVALDDVSATVWPGGVLGIVGESGSGKSTLLRMLYRSYLPDAGAVWFTHAGGTGRAAGRLEGTGGVAMIAVFHHVSDVAALNDRDLELIAREMHDVAV